MTRLGSWSAGTVGLGALTVLLLGAGSGAAEPAPAARVREQVERAIRVLEDPALRGEAHVAERRAALRRIAGELFDFTEMTRRAVGHHWQARTAAEREELVQLFTALLERAYIAKLEGYSGEKILWGSEVRDGYRAVVRTRVLTRAGTEIPVDYRLHRADGRWAVYDVTVEGVSLVANYRTQFNRILQGGSHAELVRRLKARLEEPEPPAENRRAAR